MEIVEYVPNRERWSDAPRVNDVQIEGATCVSPLFKSYTVNYNYDNGLFVKDPHVENVMRNVVLAVSTGRTFKQLLYEVSMRLDRSLDDRVGRETFAKVIVEERISGILNRIRTENEGQE
jgi:hypothetical protein